MERKSRLIRGINFSVINSWKRRTMKLVTHKQTVTVIDHKATATRCRAYRHRCGISLREVARRMQLSAPYVSELELGKRHWTPERLQQFQEACDR